MPIIPSPVGRLGLFGRSPLTAAVEAELPAAVWNAGFCIVARRPRDDARDRPLAPPPAGAEAAAELGVSGHFDAARPYVMLNGAIPPGVERAAAVGVDRADAAAMHELMVAAVADWHPAIRGLVEAIELDDAVFASRSAGSIRRRRGRARASPTSATRSTRCCPTLGKGANMAMHNAAVLRDALVSAERGEQPLLEAIARVRGRYAGERPTR